MDNIYNENHVIKKMLICDEDIMNLKTAFDRLRKISDPYVDVEVHTLKYIVDKWKTLPAETNKKQSMIENLIRINEIKEEVQNNWVDSDDKLSEDAIGILRLSSYIVKCILKSRNTGYTDTDLSHCSNPSEQELVKIALQWDNIGEGDIEEPLEENTAIKRLENLEWDKPTLF